MALTVAELRVFFSADTSGLSRGLKHVDKSAADTRGRLDGARKALLGFAGGFAAAGGGRALLGFLSSAINGGRDLNETVSKAKVVFGAQAGAMLSWAKQAATSFGLSRNQALASAASFGDMFTQLGFTGRQAAGMSKRVVQLAADLGSFNNLPTDTVLESIAAGFRGEYDSLQRVIPGITAARVQTQALTMTGKKSADQLTAQEKAAATLAIVQKDGARASGDFARTSDQLANRQKVLAAKWADMKDQLGSQLLPIMTAFVGFLSDRGVPALVATGEAVQAAGRFLRDNKTLVLSLAAALTALVIVTKAHGAVLAIQAAGGLAGWVKGTRLAASAARSWAAVQWLLNAALNANPIGILVTVLALLVGGLILAYKKSETFRSIVDGALRGVGKAGKWMWDSVLRPVLAALRKAFGFTVDAAKGMYKGIGRAWEWIKDATRVAVLWLVDKVLWMAGRVLNTAVKAFGWAPGIGDKLKAARDKVAEFRAGVNQELDAIRDENVSVSVKANASLPSWAKSSKVARDAGRFALGGPVTGGTPGVDSVPILAMGGEFMFDRKTVARAGGFGAMESLRRAINTGEAKTADLPHYAKGGPVFGADTSRPALARPIASMRHQAALMVAARARAIVAASMASLLKRIAATVGGSGPTKLNPAQIARAQAFARSQVGKPYVWGGAGPGGYDCSGMVGATLNAALGVGPYFRRGATGSMPWPGFSPGGGKFAVGWFTGSPGHMAATVGGLNVESAGGVGVRVGSAARGARDGMFSRIAHYDQGGWLTGIGVNTTGKPEAVLSPEESRAFKELVRNYGREPRVQLHQTVTPTPTMDAETVGRAAADRIVAKLSVLGV